MVQNYAFEKFDKNTMARSSGSNLQISLKMSTELLREIRNKKVSTVLKYLERVIAQEQVVPYRKYRAEMAHKRGKGIDTGGYPVNCAKEVLRLVKSAQKNATESEISKDLYVLSASARKGQTRHHYGRHSGRQMKSTSVEIILGGKDNK